MAESGQRRKVSAAKSFCPSVLHRMSRDYVVFPSSKSLMVIGIISAILAPLIGLILGIYFWRRPQLAKEGIFITLVALIWLAVISVDVFVFWSQEKFFIFRFHTRRDYSRSGDFRNPFFICQGRVYHRFFVFDFDWYLKFNNKPAFRRGCFKDKRHSSVYGLRRNLFEQRG